MKTKSDFLFRLVKSLTSSEKRYLKIQANQTPSKKQNYYLPLLKAIDEQTEYDETALKKKLKRKDFVKHFSTAKTRLKNWILSTLAAYNAQKNDAIQLSEQQLQVNILLSKGFFEEAQKSLEKVKQNCVELERWGFIIEWILPQQKNILLALDKLDMQAMQAMHRETKDYLLCIEQEQELEHIRSILWAADTNKLGFKREVKVKQLEELMAHPVLQSVEKLKSWRAKRFFHYSHFLYYRNTDQATRAIEHLSKLLDVLENYPTNKMQAANLRKSYITNLYNYIVLCQQIDDYATILSKAPVLQQLLKEVIASESRKQSIDFLLNVCYILTDAYCKLNMFSEAFSLIEEYEEALQQFNMYSDQAYIPALFQLAYLHFIQKKHAQTLDYLQTALQDKKSKYMPFFMSDFYILQLLTHFELGNFRLLESLIRTAQRTLKTTNFWDENSRLFFLFFPKYAFAASQTESQEILTEWQELLDNEPKTERIVHLHDWVLSKKKGLEFLEVLEQKG